MVQGFVFGNKSRHPFGEMDDIPNLIKHWPCAVKMNFPGQHTRPGRNISTNIVGKRYTLFYHIYDSKYDTMIYGLVASFQPYNNLTNTYGINVGKAAIIMRMIIVCEPPTFSWYHIGL